MTAVLQRIIQDYLSGKLLTVVERQLLQQYIQMEQQKRVAQQQAQQQAHLRGPRDGAAAVPGPYGETADGAETHG